MASDALLAVAGEADGQVDRRGPEPVPLFDLDVLGIEKESEEIGIERTRVAELELFKEVAGHGFEGPLRIRTNRFYARQPWRR
jgi:hypothetical protein